MRTDPRVHRTPREHSHAQRADLHFARAAAGRLRSPVPLQGDGPRSLLLPNIETSTFLFSPPHPHRPLQFKYSNLKIKSAGGEHINTPSTTLKKTCVLINLLVL